MTSDTQEWQEIAISDVAEFASGALISVAKLFEESAAAPVPVFGGNGIAGYTQSPTVIEPTVILGRVGQKCGAVYRNSGPAWVTDNALFARRFKRKVDISFFAYALENAHLNDLRNRNDLPLITQGILNEVRIAVPSTLEEQELISASLQDADTLVDSLVQLIAKKRDIKQGLVQQLLTGQMRLPGFADEWRELTLGDHVSYIKSVALSREQLDERSPLKYLHYGDIHTRARVRLDASLESMPRAPLALAGRAGRLEQGDLVFADASEDPAGVGKSVELTAVPAAGVVPGLHTIAARFDKRVLADGFKAYLQFIPEFRAALLRLAAGTKVLATTRNYISSVTLLLPGVEEQHAIASVLRDADAEIVALERRLKSARAIRQGMMQELLTGRTRLPTGEAAA